MPKEISHRILADRSLSRLKVLLERCESETLRFSLEAAYTYPNLFRFGSTTPDTIFYFAFSSSSVKSRKIVNRSHRAEMPGSFSWMPLFRELLEKSETEKEKGMIHAYALGILNHLAADFTFHPLVRHFAPSERAHHLLEMRLDLHFLSRERREGESRSFLYLKDIAQRAVTESEGLLYELFYHYSNSFLEQQDREQSGEQKEGQLIDRDSCRKTIALHCSIQRLFFSPFIRGLLRGPSLILPMRVGKYLDLFYHGTLGCCFFDNLGIEELEKKTAHTFLSWIVLFNDYLNGKADSPAGPDADQGERTAEDAEQWKRVTGEGSWSYKQLKKELSR